MYFNFNTFIIANSLFKIYLSLFLSFFSDVMIEIDPSAADIKIWEYQCSQCGNTFAQKRYLAFHLKNTCQKDPRFFCALCTAKYKKKYDLEAHILHKHMNN